MDADKFIYHYTSIETALLIIDSMKLRMGRLDGVNDPKESSNRDFTFYARYAASTVHFETQSFHNIEEDLTKKTFAFCCVKSDVVSDGQHVKALLPNLWAHYGNNHKGVCFVFNFQKLNEQIRLARHVEDLYQGEMRYFPPAQWEDEVGVAYHAYLEDFLEDSGGFMSHHVKNNFQQLFFTKQISWGDEKEYRWIARSIEQREYIEFSIVDCLEMVVLGSAVKFEDEESIKKLCEPLGCRVETVTWRSSGGAHTEKVSGEYLKLDGSSYSLDVPCAAALTRVESNFGATTLLIESNGNVRHWGGDGADENLKRIRATALSLTWEQANTKGAWTNLVSASRLAKTGKEPLRIKVLDGRPVLEDDEERPFLSSKRAQEGAE